MIGSCPTYISISFHISVYFSRDGTEKFMCRVKHDAVTSFFHEDQVEDAMILDKQNVPASPRSTSQAKRTRNIVRHDIMIHELPFIPLASLYITSSPYGKLDAVQWGEIN